jgi:hypothetical protein
MTCRAEYALVDVGNGRSSEGKILVLVDDERIAADMAAELRRRGCRVVIKAIELHEYGAAARARIVDGDDRLSVPATR